MKNVLYIHGFQSSPRPEKVSVLNTYFDKVIAPYIDWENRDIRKNLFNDLNKVINENQITHVVGSSMGGQMAFYLGLKNNIETLCFNPAFGIRYDDFNFTLNKNSHSNVIFLLGKNDDCVNPEKTKEFLISNELINNVDILTEDIGHQISLPIFTKYIGLIK